MPRTYQAQHGASHIPVSVALQSVLKSLFSTFSVSDAKCTFIERWSPRHFTSAYASAARQGLHEAVADFDP